MIKKSHYYQYSSHSIFSFFFFSFIFLCPLSAFATPLIALKEANNCGGCHKPGRSQRPVLWRRCTLDCQGCHVDPNGAGPRNAWGAYYAQDQMAALKFFQEEDPLKDESRLDLHLDQRTMIRQSGEKTRGFPMNTEMSLRIRPFVKWLHFTGQLLYLGRPGDGIEAKLPEGVRRKIEKFHVQVDGLPMNMHIKAARGTPLYGVRRPNHSLWIRERIGLDQFSLQDFISVGGTPNVPFMHMSQMYGDPFSAEEDKQKGISAHAGLRGVTLGWHVNGSHWRTQSQKAFVDMNAIGVGANILGLVVYGERNWRKVSEKALSVSDLIELDSIALRLHPSSRIQEVTVAGTWFPGVMFGVVGEWLEDDERSSRRVSQFIDIHPIPFFQLEIWRRTESGSRTLRDTLAVAHVLFDF
ncbi:MAG: hypothetical protein AB8C84_10055 [Oligoflexales bacterium]